jgi:hypothetical protein
VAIGGDATGNLVGAQANGVSSIAIGGRNAGASASVANGPGAIAIGGGVGGINGARTLAGTQFGIAIGGGAIAGNQDVAIGLLTTTNASANSVAMGTGASVGAGSDSSVAIGNGATVTAGSTTSTALGAGAVAANTNTTAIGAGAVATAPNQMVFGTAANIYQAPGITSAASLAAQSGPLQVVTSDAGGNLATDHGFLFGSINSLNSKVRDLGAGVAVASSLSTPDRTGSQTWAVAVNWGNFEGFNAISGSAIAAIAHDTFFPGDMISLAGSVGASTDRNQVAGRVSLQIAGGGYAPLK